MLSNKCRGAGAIIVGLFLCFVLCFFAVGFLATRSVKCELWPPENEVCNGKQVTLNTETRLWCYRGKYKHW